MVAAGDPVYAADVNKLATIFDQRTSDAAAITSTTLVTVLSVTLPFTGTYTFDSLIIASHQTAVGRPGFALGGTSTPTAWRWGSAAVQYNTATGSQGSNAAGTSYPAATAGGALLNSDWSVSSGFSTIRIIGTVTVSATGTLDFRISEQSGSGGVNVRACSMVTVNFAP